MEPLHLNMFQKLKDSRGGSRHEPETEQFGDKDAGRVTELEGQEGSGEQHQSKLGWVTGAASDLGEGGQ